jgi:hypothetical protein
VTEEKIATEGVTATRDFVCAKERELVRFGAFNRGKERDGR